MAQYISYPGYLSKMDEGYALPFVQAVIKRHIACRGSVGYQTCPDAAGCAVVEAHIKTCCTKVSIHVYKVTVILYYD